MLDGKAVPIINAFLEGSTDAGIPSALSENAGRIFQGSNLLGNGFIIDEEAASKMVQMSERNRDVIFPILNGDELNNVPSQVAARRVIYFRDWPLPRVEGFEAPLRHVINQVKPERDAHPERPVREKWWLYKRPTPDLYARTFSLKWTFVAAATTKHLNFSAIPSPHVFTHAVYVFPSDRWDLYAVIQSAIHEVWARKYSGALETRLRYSPSDCFETFPFPQGLWQTSRAELASLGEQHHEHRRALMRRLQLGLTDVYNLFHDHELTPAEVARVSKRTAEAETGYEGIVKLRNLHRELDQAVLSAYERTSEVVLGHDFHEVETLPENDRVRFTISPTARKEILRCLLALNHERAALEKAATTNAPKPKKVARKPKSATVPAAIDELDLGLDVLDRPLAAAFSLPNGSRQKRLSGEYLLMVIPELLTQAGGRLSWDGVVQAMSFLGRPHLMEAHALPDNLAEVQAWRKSGTQLFGMRDIRPTLLTLGRLNLSIERNDLVWIGGPLKQHDADAAYDAHLALKVVQGLSVAITPDREVAELNSGFSSLKRELAPA